MVKNRNVPVIGSHLLATKYVCSRYRVMNLVVDDGYASVKASDYEVNDFLNPDIWVNYTSLLYGTDNYQPPHKIEIQNFVDGWELVIMIVGREVNGDDVRFKFKVVSFNKFLSDVSLDGVTEAELKPEPEVKPEVKPKTKPKTKPSAKKSSDKITSSERLASAIEAHKKADKDIDPRAVI